MICEKEKKAELQEMYLRLIFSRDGGSLSLKGNVLKEDV
jgi:hypothetical protein